MARWQPDAQERLREAALELYASRGFEETTVADIAESVGLTERTFFRYFSDKREVLFANSEQLLEAFVAGIDAAGDELPPLAMVAEAVIAGAHLFPDERLAHSRRRQGVISANPELQERELRKMGALAAGLAGALRSRGIAEPSATLAAESGVVAFRLSFEAWVDPANTRPLVEIERGMFERLSALSAG
ncbi:TetR family transcriptional regulator [soil metagenome]